MTQTRAEFWRVTRIDGQVMGFTNHDQDIEFEGVAYRADAGLQTSRTETSLGLGSDNAEIKAAISHDAITLDDLELGLYQGAKIESFSLDWVNKSEKKRQFIGEIADIEFGEHGMSAQVHSIFDKLNMTFGRGYRRACDAKLGDQFCQFDTKTPGFSGEGLVVKLAGTAILVSGLEEFDAGWFTGGKLVVDDVPQGLESLSIKTDKILEGMRYFEFWQVPKFPLAANMRLTAHAGCDKKIETCRAKFSNVRKFRGFPHIPGENWLQLRPNDSAE